MSLQKPITNEQSTQSLLNFYRDKVIELQKQQQNELKKWISNCQQNISTHRKQHKLQKTTQTNKKIQIKLMQDSIQQYEEQLQYLSIQQQKLSLQFQQIHLISTINDNNQVSLINVVDLQLPCLIGQVINNNLRLHNNDNYKRYMNSIGQQYELGYKLNNCKYVKNPKNKKNYDDKIKKSKSEKQIIIQNKYHHKNQNNDHVNQVKKQNQKVFHNYLQLIKKNNNNQLILLEKYQQQLQQFITTLKTKLKQKQQKQNPRITTLSKQYTQLQKHYKQLQHIYLHLQQKCKQKKNNLDNQNNKLIKISDVLNKKIYDVLFKYQKQNKVKMELLLRSQQDFQQNYKAQMRAQQRNLQSLKQNYQKNQQTYIKQIRALQQQLKQKKNDLHSQQCNTQFMAKNLLTKLNQLQKLFNNQTLQQNKTIISQKQKLFNEVIRQRKISRKQKKKQKKYHQAKTVYNTTKLPSKIKQNILIVSKQDDYDDYHEQTKQVEKKKSTSPEKSWKRLRSQGNTKEELAADNNEEKKQFIEEDDNIHLQVPHMTNQQIPSQQITKQQQIKQ